MVVYDILVYSYYLIRTSLQCRYVIDILVNNILKNVLLAFNLLLISNCMLICKCVKYNQQHL